MKESSGGGMSKRDFLKSAVGGVAAMAGIAGEAEAAAQKKKEAPRPQRKQEMVQMPEHLEIAKVFVDHLIQKFSDKKLRQGEPPANLEGAINSYLRTFAQVRGSNAPESLPELHVLALEFALRDIRSRARPHPGVHAFIQQVYDEMRLFKAAPETIPPDPNSDPDRPLPIGGSA